MVRLGIGEGHTLLFVVCVCVGVGGGGAGERGGVLTAFLKINTTDDIFPISAGTRATVILRHGDYF